MILCTIFNAMQDIQYHVRDKMKYYTLAYDTTTVSYSVYWSGVDFDTSVMLTQYANKLTFILPY